MKTHRLWSHVLSAAFLLVVFGCSRGAGVPARALQTGASRAEVLESLGKPLGRMQVADREILTYPRASVEIMDGQVVRVTSRTPTHTKKTAVPSAAHKPRSTGHSSYYRSREKARQTLEEVQRRHAPLDSL